MSRWPEVPAGEVLELDRQPVDVDPMGTYTQVGIRSFGKGLFTYPPCPPSGLSKLRYFSFPPNALAISNIKAWEGAVAISPSNWRELVASNRFLFYVPRRAHEIDVDFIRAFLLSDEGIRRLGSESPGSADRNRTLSQAGFERLKIPLPPLDEQRRIAARLAAATDRLQSADALADSVRNRVDRLRAVLVSTVCESAPLHPIGELFALRREPAEVVSTEQYRQIGVRSFGRGLIRYPSVVGSDLGRLRYFTFPPGALIVSNIKAWEGAVALSAAADGARIASNRFLPYVPRDKSQIDLHFALEYLLSDRGRALLGGASPGSADRNRTLAIDRFEALPIPVPPPDDQRRFAQAAQQLAGLRDLEQSRAELRDAIVPAMLNEVFSGSR